MERITCDLDALKADCKVLGVPEDFDMNSLKKAYRRASLKYHPDHNHDDPDANKKFVLVKCAYELLAKDRPCPAILEEIKSRSGVPEDDMYRLDSLWGHFCGGATSFLAEYKICQHGKVSAIM